MGQYYVVVNLNKKEFLNPHAFGDGRKLTEFGASGSGTMLGLALLIADGNGRGSGDIHGYDEKSEALVAKISGQWLGDPVINAGDYADNLKWLTPEMIERYQKEVPPLLKNEYEESYKKGIYSSRKIMKEYLSSQLKRIENKEFTLYDYAQRFFKDISLNVIKAICCDLCIKDDIISSIEWRSDEDIPAFLRAGVKKYRKTKKESIENGYN